MQIGRTGSRGRWAVGLMLSTVLLFAPTASAYMLLYCGNGLQNYWYIVCNDGAATLGYESVSASMQYAGVFCSDHGGVAPVGDDEIEGALAALEPADPPSSATFAQDLGAAGYQPLTTDDVEALLAASGGEPVELVGYELASLVIGARELLPEPVPGLTGFPLLAIYSNEDDSGPLVGGATVPAVPIGSGAAWPVGLALLLLCSGSLAACGRRRRRRS
ncbi:MAG: hypothetical protein ACX98W_12520 [bacterium]